MLFDFLAVHISIHQPWGQIVYGVYTTQVVSGVRWVGVVQCSEKGGCTPRKQRAQHINVAGTTSQVGGHVSVFV